MSDRWYVVNTKNRLENFAAENLWEQGFRVFFPRYKKIVERHGRQMPLVLPFYPGYVFVCFDIDTDPWKRIYGTRGVVQLVCASEDSATPVPIGFVEDLVDQCNEEGYLTMQSGVEIMQSYMPGEELEVKEGPLAGMLGVCESSDKDRVRIFLTLLSRETTVSLPVSVVQRNTSIGGSVESTH